MPGRGQRRALLFGALDRCERPPLLFLASPTYFENRFEFYDLLVKRGAMLMATCCARPVLRRWRCRGSMPCRATAPRPWLFALAAVPLALALPRRPRAARPACSTGLVRPPLHAGEAVTHVLGSMQRRPTKQPLAGAEQPPVGLFGATVVISTVADIRRPRRASPWDRTRSVAVRRCDRRAAHRGRARAAQRGPALLRSLAVSFGAMLENVACTSKRQEQELSPRSSASRPAAPS